MAYSLIVRAEDIRGIITIIVPAWRHFCKDIHQTKSHDRSLIDLINEGLAPYNGRKLPFEHYLEFDTEEDAIAFVLRWS